MEATYREVLLPPQLLNSNPSFSNSNRLMLNMTKIWDTGSFSLCFFFFLHLYIENEITAEKMRKELIVYLLARTMTREDVAIIQERRMSQQSQGTI